MSLPFPYRIVATDLDGTIVRSDGTIAERTRQALRAVQDAGALVVFVTGRPPRWMGEVAEATGHTGLAVCANGAILYDLGEERVVHEIALQATDLAAITDKLVEALPDIVFAVERNGLLSHEPGYHPSWEDDDRPRVVPRPELLRDPVVKLLARHPASAPDELLALAQEIVGELATLTRSGPEALVEISAVGVTKASGLERFARTEGIVAEQVIAFGDMPNDLPMLAWAGHAVAVANAHPEVLELADEVTTTNDDDGVAAVLERLLTP